MGKFEFDGEKYKQASKHQKEWGNKLIAGMNISSGEIILDLGCGDGVLTEQLAEMVPEGKVIGIDASAGMIETAQKIVKDNLIFVCLDINDINYENYFDIIYSNAALHWVKNHKLLLSNCIRALKQGGTIAWNFAGDGTCSNFYAAADEAMSMPHYREFFENYECPWYMPGRDEYMGLIENAGFMRFEVVYENADRYFSDADEMIKWIDQPSIVPFLQYLPDDKKEGFRNEVVERMVGRTRQPDGRCLETFRRLNIKAVK